MAPVFRLGAVLVFVVLPLAGCSSPRRPTAVARTPVRSSGPALTAANLKITRTIGDADGDGVADTALIYQARTSFAVESAPSTVEIVSGRTGAVLASQMAVALEDETYLAPLTLSGPGRGGLLIDRQQPTGDSSDLVTAIAAGNRVLWTMTLRDDDTEMDLVAGVGDVLGTGHSEAVVTDDTAVGKAWRGDIRVIDGTTGVVTRVDEQRRHGVSAVMAGHLDGDRSVDLIVGDDAPSIELAGVMGHHVAGFSVSLNRQLRSQRSLDFEVLELPDFTGGDQSQLPGDGSGDDVTGDGRSDLVWSHAYDIKGQAVTVTVMPGDGSPGYALGPFLGGNRGGLLVLPAAHGGEVVGIPARVLVSVPPGGENRIVSHGYVAAYQAGGREIWRVAYAGRDLKLASDLDHDGKPDLQLGEGGPVISSATGRTLRAKAGSR